MFKIVSFAFCCINFNIISSEVALEWFVPKENPFTMPPDWTDIITSLDNFQNSTNKQDKFASLIKLLKTTLWEEFETVPCNNIVENNQEPVIITCVKDKSSLNNPSKTDEIDYKNITKMESEEMLAQAATTINKSKCTKPGNQLSVDVPTMIPIFKPKKNNTEKKKCGTKSDFNKKSLEAKGNMSPNSNTPVFTIPCHRTSDILDGSYLIPKVTYETTKSNESPNAQSVKTNLQCAANSSSSSKLISSVESDDVIAVLFKPKTISMMQVYGNLLKKITMTVLVPFYVSKLAL